MIEERAPQPPGSDDRVGSPKPEDVRRYTRHAMAVTGEHQTNLRELRAAIFFDRDGTLINDVGMTIRGHGTINPPFVNWGTVDLDGAQIARQGRFLNHGTIRVGRGSLILSGRGVTLSNMGQLTIAGGSRIDKGCGWGL